ncbi:MAG: 50S ribosomal protein L10 [Dehalococcoidia bacterium]|nr:50S ribosomal protein L10 [Dehalococcoidia bacterium]MDZ4247151.1 50S ribosomal protein L10 [Dehalococcoidia bacterium]
MPTEKKIKKVSELEENISKCTSAVATNYVGMNANFMTEFRQSLRAQGIEYKIVKNTLARLAADKAGKAEFRNLLQGTVGIAFGYGDVIVPAKTVAEYIRTSKAALTITGGFIGNRFVTAQEVISLAYLPSREVLLARLFGQMNAPIVGLLGVLTGNMRGLMTVLNGRIKQLEAVNN